LLHFYKFQKKKLKAKKHEKREKETVEKNEKEKIEIREPVLGRADCLVCGTP
jgi:hypothetical protein